jgi:putative transposase
MRTNKYPSDLTDEQWALVEPLIPVYPGGRPRKTSMRAVGGTIFYLLRTGCPWRYPPKDFPPKSTVWGYFDRWCHNGTLEKIHDTLRDRARQQAKPSQPRRTASPSVDTNAGGEPRGRDHAKKVDGRKRSSIVDRLGLLRAVVVTAAAVDDAAAAAEALRQLADQPVGKLRLVSADNQYHHHALYGWVAENG